MLLEINPENGFLPFVKVDAMASFVKNFDGPEDFKAEDYFRVPGVGPAAADQKLFEVEGDSMVPTVFPKDVILCQVQSQIENLLKGTLIVLVTRESVLVKRFDEFDIDGNFVVSDDNPEKEPQVYVLKREDVRQVMVVRGKISTTLVPHQHVLSQGKMKFMEESIEFLEKEVQKLSEKMNDSDSYQNRS